MSKLSHLVQLMSYVHDDNVSLLHYARSQRDHIDRSTMPLTSFIYEFFLYNALYSIDWEKSVVIRDVIYSSKRGEKAKQNDFEYFIKSLNGNYTSLFLSSFMPLTQISFKGDWTEVIPDTRITKDKGYRFFHGMEKLKQLINDGHANNKYNIESIFNIISECRYYVYLVRCNVFHGSKNVTEIDSDHKKRIDAYCLFLKCLLNGFFKQTKKGDIFSVTA